MGGCSLYNQTYQTSARDFPPGTCIHDGDGDYAIGDTCTFHPTVGGYAYKVVIDTYTSSHYLQYNRDGEGARPSCTRASVTLARWPFYLPTRLPAPERQPLLPL